MPLETVGRAFLNAVFNVLLERITPELKALFETRKMDGNLLQKLKIQMITVNEVLVDAEQKQITTPDVNSPVKEWLNELRDAAYEAEDLVDLIAYEVTAARIQADSRTIAHENIRHTSWSGSQFKKPSAGYSEGVVAKKMGEIVERLGELVDQIVPLGLRGVRHEAWPQREPTTSLVEESDIFGRDADRDAILKLLKEDDAKIGVIPIVGMGGIGKTTLAGLVYEHSLSIMPKFEVRAWVCVSDNYNGLKIKKELLKQVNESVNCENLSVEQIDRKIKESLEGKRFLLVLDDMWNESRNEWENLQKPLKSGKRGSKIIVTTRSHAVASIMCTVKSYQLPTLVDDYCWSLFSRRAFNGRNEDPKLKAIGEKIVSKCKGLPLAIKMLGDLLRLKQEVVEWEAILKSDIWDLENDEILPALRLSYWHLPSHLKQCFVYCALFPKDYRIQKEEIIQLWMAEDFLIKPKRGRGRTMVEWGEDCLQELVSRSFIQKYNSCFLMHDLVNDLARDLSRGFLIRLDGDKYCDFDTRYRYLSFVDSNCDNSMILDIIRKAPFLRTIWQYWGYGSVDELMIVETCINDLERLRVLNLSDFPIVELPKSIGKLKHLRYLNLEDTRVERLPETVCSLFNLQTVILHYCEQLIELPRDFGDLINLHFLDIRKTKKLKEMPPKMGNLKDLQTLCKFLVGKANGSDLNELGKLQHLRGKLSIYNLENAVGSPNDILKNTEHLKELKLIWSGETENTLHENKLLEGLQPHTNIEKLSIFGYGGARFADWVGQASYSNIVGLKLHGCKNCLSFPSLDLSSLEDLSISKFDAVEEVSMKIPLNSLKTLHIEDMKQWQKWIFGEENDSDEKRGSLAKLEELRIQNCPQLKFISRCGPTHMIFESLNNLMIKDCSPCLDVIIPLTTTVLNSCSSTKGWICFPMGEDPSCSSTMYGISINRLGVEGVEEMGSALESVIINRNESVECIPLEVFPVLKSLEVESCDNLKFLSLSGEPLPHQLVSLTSLRIKYCRSLTCFPKGGISAPNLTELELRECSSLKSLPERMHELLPSLQKSSISYCKEVESFPEGGLPTKLKSVEIEFCNDKVINGVLQWGLQALDFLSDLSLGRYNGADLDFFPQEMMLPSSLTSLKIRYFENLKYINCKAIKNLINLRIFWCPNLQGLVGGLASSITDGSIEEVDNLQSLQIIGCDKFIRSRMQWDMQRFKALSQLSLSVYEGDDLDSFPEELLLPSALTSLSIGHFKNLKGIKYEGLQHLTSLSQLKFERCPNLQCLPEEGLPSSLSLLKIWKCPLLEKRCERDIGEDWPKISYISTIKINYQTIQGETWRLLA